MATIERDNLILLDKMMDIMKKPSSLDNKSTTSPYNRSASPSKSLNREARKREVEKINADNQVSTPLPPPLLFIEILFDLNLSKNKI